MAKYRWINVRNASVRKNPTSGGGYFRTFFARVLQLRREAKEKARVLYHEGTMKELRELERAIDEIESMMKEDGILGKAAAARRRTLRELTGRRTRSRGA